MYVSLTQHIYDYCIVLLDQLWSHARPRDWVLGFDLGERVGFWVLGSAGRLGFGFWARPGDRVLGFQWTPKNPSKEATLNVLVS